METIFSESVHNNIIALLNSGDKKILTDCLKEFSLAKKENNISMQAKYLIKIAEVFMCIDVYYSFKKSINILPPIKIFVDEIRRFLIQNSLYLNIEKDCFFKLKNLFELLKINIEIYAADAKINDLLNWNFSNKKSIAISSTRHGVFKY